MQNVALVMEQESVMCIQHNTVKWCVVYAKGVVSGDGLPYLLCAVMPVIPFIKVVKDIEVF